LLHVDVRKNVHIAEPDSTNKHIIFMTKGMPQDDIMAINGMAYRKIQKIFDLTHEKTKKKFCFEVDTILTIWKEKLSS